jgi:hypothetical protein
MSPRSLFAILIKLTGVYIIFTSITAIPQLIYTAFIFIPQFNRQDQSNAVLIQIILIALIVIAYGLTLYLTIFKTDWIIDKLGLDKGFQEEQFKINVHRSILLKIVVMIIGGILLIDSFPLLCKNLLTYFQQANQFRKFTDSPQSGYIVVYLLKTFIGYFMLTCSRMVVNLIELKSKKSAGDVIVE